MAKKEFTFRGLTVAELKKLTLQEFAKLVPARARRSLTRGFSHTQLKLLKKVKAEKIAKTHARDMIIVPEMLDKHIKVYDGKSFIAVAILPEMLGHTLGEFVQTRKKVSHSAPGIGATKSSASMSVK